MASSFTPLLTTTIPPSGLVTCAAWCPTMDLLALGTADGKLAVRRLNWQRLWVVDIGGSSDIAPGPACVAWRPDGRALVCPCVAGGLEVRAAEDGRVLTTTAGRGEGAGSAHHRPPVVALAWAVERPGLPPPPGSLLAGAPPARECPVAPPAPVVGGGEGGGSSGLAAAGTPSAPTHHPRRAPTAAEPGRLDLLAAADAGGAVTLYGPGLLKLAVVELGGGASIAGLALADDLSRLWALSTSAPPTAPPFSPPQLHLSALDTSALALASPELRRVAHCLGRLADAVDDARRGLARAAGAWGGGAGAAAAGRVVGDLARLQADNATPGADPTSPGAPGTPAGAAATLRRAMLTGTGGGGGGGGGGGCPGLAALLERPPWGEAGLKRAARDADAAAAAAGGALAHTVEPALEAAAYWAGELGCVAACERWSGPLGLSGGCVGRVAALARDACAAAAAARLAVARGTADGRALFIWLLLAAGAAGGGSGGPPRPGLDASPGVSAAAARALEALVASDAAGAALAAAAAGEGGEGPGTPGAAGDPPPPSPAIPAAVWAGLGGRAAGGGASLASLAAALAAGVGGLAAGLAAALSPRIVPAGPPAALGALALPPGTSPACVCGVEALPEGRGVAAAWGCDAGVRVLLRAGTATVGEEEEGRPPRTASSLLAALPAPPAALALYRGGGVVVLMGAQGEEAPACLALLSAAPPGEEEGGGGGRGDDGGAAWVAARRRALHRAAAPSTPIPLAVSAPRGVAVVLDGCGDGGGDGQQQRTAALFDLEAEEEGDEGDEGMG